MGNLVIHLNNTMLGGKLHKGPKEKPAVVFLNYLPGINKISAEFHSKRVFSSTASTDDISTEEKYNSIPPKRPPTSQLFVPFWMPTKYASNLRSHTKHILNKNAEKNGIFLQNKGAFCTNR